MQRPIKPCTPTLGIIGGPLVIGGLFIGGGGPLLPIIIPRRTLKHLRLC